MNSAFIQGTHIYLAEYRCNHCGGLPPDFIREGEISEEYAVLFHCYENIIDKFDERIPVSRGYSCRDHQISIYLNSVKKKYKELTNTNIITIIKDGTMTPYSVHIFGLALDLIPPPERRIEVVNISKKIEPKLRIGWRGYSDGHIHIDLGYWIYPRYHTSLVPGAEW